MTSCAPNTVLDGVKQDVDDGLAGLPDLNDEVEKPLDQNSPEVITFSNWLS